MRKMVNLNENWKFLKDDVMEAIEDSCHVQKWDDVSIPHTWNDMDGANGVDYYKGVCWYRKSFRVDQVDEKKQMFIEFQGANSIADVYLNGKYIGQHRGGYSTFRFDVTNAIRFGAENILAVKVDNRIVSDVYPQFADFTFFGGIYRDVNLVIVNPVHFDLTDYGSLGVYITQNSVSEKSAMLSIKARLVNSSDVLQKVQLWLDVYNMQKQKVIYTVKELTIEPKETKVIEVPIEITAPILWNGQKNPYLYEVKSSIISFNDVIDELTIPTGIRYFEVSPEAGFILNGSKLRLNGVSRHQDFKDKGWAITTKEQNKDMSLIKEMGANSIRLAHYQHDQYFYDLCDQEGMVVWAEIPFISKMSETDLEGVNAKQQMIELVKQNYNHPAIIFWGVQNEIQIVGDSKDARRVVKELHQIVKKEDPNRLTTLANVGFVPNDDEYNDMTDVIGYNQYFGWYQGKVEDFGTWIDKFHKNKPHVCLSISEYGAEGVIEYHSEKPRVLYTEEYHTLYHEIAWKVFEKRSFLWSTYVWNMFDFGSSIRDEGGVKGRNNKGLVTYDRKIKKDAFYMYKAHWSDEKFIHINSKRFVDRKEREIELKIYSNCSEITLYVNGEIVKTQTAEKIFTFNIKLEKGLNTIKACALENDEAIEDIAIFNRVDIENKKYMPPEGSARFSVTNWFEIPDLDDVVVEAIEITDEVYSTKCTFEELLTNDEAAKVLKKYLNNFSIDDPMFDRYKGRTIEMIATKDEDLFNNKFIYTLNKELTQIKKE